MASSEQTPKKEIYTYEAPWTTYGMNWSHVNAPGYRYRLALGSFVEEYSNKVKIVQLDVEADTFKEVAEFDHPYPTTKIMWRPDKVCSAETDLLATTGDYLRVWKMEQSTDPDVKSKVGLVRVLNNNKSSEYCAPLTSFDWNETDKSMIGTSSIDTTCTIWDLNKNVAKTQLIAHDKEVYDLAFAHGKDVFASVGADGSVRMFDLRSLEHSTIIYEDSKQDPLLRITWNKQDTNYLATMLMDSPEIVVLDIRAPTLPVAWLRGHTACVNSMAWAPHSSCHVCTAGDDRQALIWDVSHLPKPVDEPILAYNAAAEINQLQWSVTQPDWIAIAFEKKLQILRV
jgi:WD repeat-containing protein 68